MGIRYIDKAPLYQRSEQLDVTSVSTTTAVNVQRLGFYELASTTTGVPIALTLPPPRRGDTVTFKCRTVGSTSAVFAITCSSSGTTYDGTNDRVTINTSDCIELVGLSSSRWLVRSTLVNTSIAFSTSS